MGLLLAATPQAFAARTYESQMTGFTYSGKIAINAQDDVWVAEAGFDGAVSEYDANPSTTKIGELALTQQDLSQGRFENFALNNATGYVYVANSDLDNIEVFNSGGNLVETWAPTTICGDDYIAVDNSGGPTQGRVYSNRGCGAEGHTIQAFKGADEESSFSYSASYIHGNTITGTPKEPNEFGQIEGIATGSEGNFFVMDLSNHVVDEFHASGEFVQEFEGLGESAGVAVDPTNGNVLIASSIFRAGAGYEYVVNEYSSSGEYIGRLTGSTPTGPFVALNGAIAVNSEGYAYVFDAGDLAVDIFSPDFALPKVTYGTVKDITHTSGTLNATIDPNEAGQVTACDFEYGLNTEYGSGTIPCSPNPAASPPGSFFSASEPTEVEAQLSGLATGTAYHYRVVVRTANGKTKRGGDQVFLPPAVEGLLTEPATHIGPTNATLNASFAGDGEETHFYFEWATATEWETTRSYDHKTTTEDAGAPTVPTAVSFALSGLEPLTTYHYRVVATNGLGVTRGRDQTVTTLPFEPLVEESVRYVHSDGALLEAQINPGGGKATYHFEYGTVDCSVGPCTSTPVGEVKASVLYETVYAQLGSLTADTVYHYRVVATNEAGTTDGPDQIFTTFPAGGVLKDACSNAHVRQQTGAALLLDCRAYELVSAPNTGGYDVESDLGEGLSPYPAYPQASSAAGPSRVLYAVHDGAIPGDGHPTGDGPSPYLATRGKEGWNTEYVGIPADDPSASGPFSSSLLEADSTLDTFAFGGADICSPCFADGSTGIPLTHPGGEGLLQGMAPAEGISPPPSAKPDGYIAQHLSANGEHLIFGSTARFAPGGNDETGDVLDL